MYTHAHVATTACVRKKPLQTSYTATGTVAVVRRSNSQRHGLNPAPPPPPPPFPGNATPRQLFTIMRDRLMQILAEGLPSGVVNTRREVISVEESPSGATLQFEDGSTEGPFDLVVGADGIKGAARKAVRAARSGGGSENSGDDAIYSGIRIQYGVAPAGQRPQGCVDRGLSCF